MSGWQPFDRRLGLLIVCHDGHGCCRRLLGNAMATNASSPLPPTTLYVYIYISIYIHSSAKTEALRASTQHHDNLDDDIVVLSATGMFLIYEARKDWAELCS